MNDAENLSKLLGIEQAAHWTAAGLDEAIECQSA